jgi:peptidoglycan hydrolase-like protein with peptidoglycan-binding domain
MLNLRLSELPATIMGIYGPNHDILPSRMRFLAPDAAASYLSLEQSSRRLRVSDMWRSAESSLQAGQEKRGVKAPGRSGHNFGFSIDIDVRWLLKEYRMSKAQLDTEMAQAGWYCHRKDHEIDNESWHYNYFGADPGRYLDAAKPYGSTAVGLELLIQDRYGQMFTLTPLEIQTSLKSMRLYSGELDGELGALSRQALKAFQRAWHLSETGLAGTNTQRLLAFIGSTREIVLPA